jgi:hypothetical protein
VRASAGETGEPWRFPEGRRAVPPGWRGQVGKTCRDSDDPKGGRAAQGRCRLNSAVRRKHAGPRGVREPQPSPRRVRN